MNTGVISLLFLATILVVNGLTCVRKKPKQSMEESKTCTGKEACITITGQRENDDEGTESINYGCSNKKGCKGNLDGCKKRRRRKKGRKKGVKLEFCCCSKGDFCSIEKPGTQPEATQSPTPEEQAPDEQAEDEQTKPPQLGDGNGDVDEEGDPTYDEDGE